MSRSHARHIAVEIDGSVVGSVDEQGRVSDDYRVPVIHLNRLDPNKFINTHSRRRLAERAEAMRKRNIQRARNSSSAFMEYCFINETTREPYHQQWFHDEWHDAWDKHNRVMIIAPRDHAKTSNVVGRTIWELGHNSNLRVKIVCASDGRAKERLFEIDQHITSNPRVHEVFPELKPDPNAQWNAHKLILMRTAKHRDASVEALGITSTATGGRCDLLISDDAVDRRNALSFPALSRQIKQAWKSDWTNLLEPDSRVWYICTLWAPTDLSHDLMKNPAYTVLRYDIDEAFGSIWPTKWGEKNLRARHEEIGSIEFNRAFRNQAIDLESTMVHPAWFKYAVLDNDEEFNRAVAADELIYITSYDPANTPTGKKDQDYTGECVAAVNKTTGMVYILDGWHQRISVAKSAEVVFEEAILYQPWQILIEKAGQATLDEWVINEHPELAHLIKVTKPKISKAQRLMGATPLLEKGKIIFSHHLDPDNKAFFAGRGNMVGELQEFPFGKHDDMVDAFSQLIAYIRLHFLDVDADRDQSVVEVEEDEDDGYKF